jgi:hypothetical protein
VDNPGLVIFTAAFVEFAEKFLADHNGFPGVLCDRSGELN